MNKPTEQRYPSGPAKVGAQQPGGKHTSEPFYTATVLPEKGSQGPGKTTDQAPQQPARDTVKAPPRTARKDDSKPQQEPKKS